MKHIRVFKISLLILFSLFCINLYSENLYNEYRNAYKHYENKEYLQSMDILEKILEEYPEYSSAKLLYFKVFLEKNNEQFNEELFAELLKENNDIKKELLKFLIVKNKLKYAELTFDLIDSEEDVKDVTDIFFEFLFLNKNYENLFEKYKSEKYIKLIEEEKKKADEFYFQALDFLKKNETEKAIDLIEKAIATYPENNLYYFKIAQVYADNKNFYLAEKNFYLAITQNEEFNKKVYINLFKLYTERGEIGKIYPFLDKIVEYESVKKKLKEIYFKDKSSKTYVTVLKKSGDKIYINKRYFKNIEIGETYFLLKEKEVLRDKKTGEILTVIDEVKAKVRVYNIIDKVAIFHVVENTSEISLEQKYIIKIE